jgi:RNA polymerase sigma factor (sigma-70 family)
MSSQEEKIKLLKIDSVVVQKKIDLNQFTPLVEMIARKELNSKSKQIISFDELVNTGLIAVNKLIEAAKLNKETVYNSSYIAQSVKWAMKDEVRSRQTWYGVKKVVSVDSRDDVLQEEIDLNSFDPTETTVIKSIDDAKKAIFEVIMSVDSMEEDHGFTPEDTNNPNILEHLELVAMKNSLKKSVSKLPSNLKKVIELRFYKNLPGNTVADELGVTPSRVSHMIREAVSKLKVLMIAEGYNEI